MKKHSVRKWLHAILDLLPVILIPVFMVYSHRHDIEGNQAQITQSFKTDFNQLLEPTINSFYGTVEDNIYKFDFETETSSARVFKVLNLSSTGKYLFNINSLGGVMPNVGLWNVSVGGYETLNLFNNPNFVDVIVDINNIGDFNLNFVNLPINTHFTWNGYLEVFNLTQMFGSGNEPTIQQFNNWFPNDFYDYTLHQDVWVENYEQITYNDTDVMSQFSYQLYNAIDKYFNMDKTFNLGAIHEWVNNIMFNGQPPLVANIVWHIISYEFILDLIFLVYAVFMFIIDFAERCINAFFDKSFGGGR